MTAPPTAEATTQRSPASGPLGIIIAVLGGLVLLTVGTPVAVTALMHLDRGEIGASVQTTGVTHLELNADASRFTIEFAEVDQASLDSSGTVREGWDLTRDDDRLVVHSPGRFNDWCLFRCPAGEEQLVLTLPEELNDGGLDASLTLEAGMLEADGNFADLALQVDAGAASLTGAAQSLDVNLNAGRADLSIAEVSAASFDVSAGRAETELSGDAPDEVSLEVSAGMLDLTLPEVAYDLRSEVTAGSLDNQLRTSPDSQHNVFAEVNAGRATLRSED